MNEQILDLEKKMDLYQRETRENFSRIIEDRQNDADKQDDIYRKIASLSADVELLKKEIEQHTKTVKKENNETREAVAGSVEAIEENLIGKTKIVIKEVKEQKKHWYKLWRKEK